MQAHLATRVNPIENRRLCGDRLGVSGTGRLRHPRSRWAPRGTKPGSGSCFAISPHERDGAPIARCPRPVAVQRRETPRLQDRIDGIVGGPMSPRPRASRDTSPRSRTIWTGRVRTRFSSPTGRRRSSWSRRSMPPHGRDRRSRCPCRRIIRCGGAGCRRGCHEGNLALVRAPPIRSRWPRCGQTGAVGIVSALHHVPSAWRGAPMRWPPERVRSRPPA